jgi:hypothetical protein
MSKSKDHWKSVAIILIALIIIGGIIGGIFFYTNLQKVNYLENILTSMQNDLTETQDMLESARKDLSYAEASIEEYELFIPDSPSLEELNTFLLNDDTNEINYTSFAEWVELNLILRENAAEENIMTAIVSVKYNCDYRGEPREGGWTFVLATELDNDEIVYFSLANDEVYDSLEQLLNDWEDISNAEVYERAFHWR